MAEKPTGDVDILAVTKAWKFRGDARAILALLGTLGGAWGGWTLGRQDKPGELFPGDTVRRLDAIESHLAELTTSSNSVQTDLREVRSMLLQLGARRSSRQMVPSHDTDDVTMSAATVLAAAAP